MTVLLGNMSEDSLCKYDRLYDRLRDSLFKEHCIPYQDENGWYIITREDYRSGKKEFIFVPYPDDPEMPIKDFKMLVNMCKL